MTVTIQVENDVQVIYIKDSLNFDSTLAEIRGTFIDKRLFLYMVTNKAKQEKSVNHLLCILLDFYSILLHS